jgi:beta-phosphoglucomutase
MQITNYSLILFDFDGLLVDSERLHYNAYQKMFAMHGTVLPWDFLTFLGIAHRSATSIREESTKLFPEIIERNGWDILYREKTAIYLDLIKSGELQLMPGVKEMLLLLEEKNIPTCVVTHSPKEQVVSFKEKIPILKKIPTWVTREDYKNPKPAPDGYLKALEICKTDKEQAIGFEDAARGIQALKSAGITPVLICSPDHPQMKMIDKDLLYFPSFHEVLDR